MPDLLPLLGSALILGLLGGGHCLGMCGGLMGALTLAIPPEQRGRRLRLLLAYNVGRILSYACAGLLLGALWGWLPCGLVYSTLLWAASQGHAGYSAALMLAFGLGTWPVLLATGLAAERVSSLLRRRSVRMAGGLLVILFGLWTLPGPHQHWLMGH